jgi:hypothetical protein
MTSKAFELARLGNAYSDGALSNRNLIINGAMQVAQRGASASGVSASGYYTCDRWNYHRDGSEVITLSQESDAPADFKYSQKILVTTADTDIPVSSLMRLEQRIEASSLRFINQGTASAKQLTVSFWVKSNKTGSFAVGLFNDNNGATISQAYTINASGVWEYKTVTFVADTSVSTLSATDNATGLRLWFPLASGTNFNSGTSNVWSTSASHRAVGQSVNLFDATNNYWQITGIQLEVGDTATPFEHRSFGEELARCQRYYWNSYEDVADVGGSGADGALYAVCGPVTSDRYFTEIQFPTQMRAQPTLTYYGGRDGVADTAARVSVYNGDTLRSFSTSPINSRKGFSGYFDTGYNDNAVRFQVIADAEL